MTDPTPSTPRRLLMPDLCVVCDHHGSPGHAMDVATQVAAALGPGWTLSRQQGDTVAARVGCTHCCENGHVDADDMVTMEMDAYGRGFDDGAEGRTRFASLEDPTVAGLATVRVGDVARRLHEDRRDSHEGVGTSCPRCMDDARWLLGVGADGAGDGR